MTLFKMLSMHSVERFRRRHGMMGSMPRFLITIAAVGEDKYCISALAAIGSFASAVTATDQVNAL